MTRNPISVLKIVAILFLAAVISVSLTELSEYNSGKRASEELVREVISQSDDLKTPIEVDFEELSETNSDIIGWIYCENTPINYAIVQEEDNNYYLRRDLNEQYNYSGSIFVDFRNNGDFSDKNTIIYGHNMKNDAMFGTLTNYEDEEYFAEHPEMYLITPDTSYKIKLIAGIEQESTAEFYNDLLDVEKTEKMINAALEKSTFKSNYVFSSDDRFVTLSTCSYDYDNARFIVIGKLE